MDASDWQPDTILLHAGMLRSGFEESNAAIYMSSGFVYQSAEAAEQAFAAPGSRYVYARVANPNAAMLERKLAQYEGAERCFTTASGMSAVFSALAAALKSGDRVVAPRTLFSSCYYVLNDILPRYGIEVTFLDDPGLPAWEAALSRPAQVVFFETPGNPGLDLVDIAGVSALAHKAGALVIVDNVFATPVLQRPLDLGADIVVYSMTKHMDGQGRCNGGAILCSESFVEKLGPFLVHTGPMLAQFSAWVLYHGLETLEMRVQRQCDNAEAIVDFLKDRAELSGLRYPFLAGSPGEALAHRQMKRGGSLVTLDIAGGKEAAFRFMNGLRLISISNNLGDSKSLITHPRTTTHQKLSDAECAAAGIFPGTLRLSVGLESAGDLLYDLGLGLAAIPSNG
jgi:O-succinylhomoserine sulfhydrylase